MSIIMIIIIIIIRTAPGSWLWVWRGQDLDDDDGHFVQHVGDDHNGDGDDDIENVWPNF